MRKCLKILPLLIHRKVAEVGKDKIKLQKYEKIIKDHIKICPDCREFLEEMGKKSGMEIDFSKIIEK